MSGLGHKLGIWMGVFSSLLFLLGVILVLDIGLLFAFSQSQLLALPFSKQFLIFFSKR
jgi:hypothetical protein